MATNQSNLQQSNKPMTSEERKAKIQQEFVKFMLAEMAELQKQPHTEQTTVRRGTIGITMVECTDAKLTDYVKVDDLIDNRFRVTGKLREGGFGQIYKAFDANTSAEVALKLEMLEAGKRHLEAVVLTKFHKSSHCPKIFARGKVRNFVSYVAMQLLGKNLSELRKSCPLVPPRFSIGTATRLIAQCLRAAEDLHNLGYIHRDIKPSNYSMGGQEDDQQVVYMLDFGLCRYILSKDGTTVLTPRKKSGFRGTVRYASVNAHDLKDLSRRDDMWSIFYSFYEFMNGTLPWNSIDKATTGRLKHEFSPKSMAIGRLPVQGVEFVKYVEQLQFPDRPLYDDMEKCLISLCIEYKSKVGEPFDWQLENACRTLTHWSSPA